MIYCDLDLPDFVHLGEEWCYGRPKYSSGPWASPSYGPNCAGYPDQKAATCCGWSWRRHGRSSRPATNRDRGYIIAVIRYSPRAAPPGGRVEIAEEVLRYGCEGGYMILNCMTHNGYHQGINRLIFLFGTLDIATNRDAPAAPEQGRRPGEHVRRHGSRNCKPAGTIIGISVIFSLHCPRIPFLVCRCPSLRLRTRPDRCVNNGSGCDMTVYNTNPCIMGRL